MSKPDTQTTRRVFETPTLVFNLLQAVKGCEIGMDATYTLEEVSAWQPQQRGQVARWATALLCKVGGDHTIDVPPIPEFVRMSDGPEQQQTTEQADRAENQVAAERRWHFECPDCQYDSGEHGELLADNVIHCPLCWEDCGRLVRLHRWESHQ